MTFTPECHTLTAILHFPSSREKVSSYIKYLEIDFIIPKSNRMTSVTLGTRNSSTRIFQLQIRQGQTIKIMVRLRLIQILIRLDFNWSVVDETTGVGTRGRSLEHMNQLTSIPFGTIS